MQKYEPTTKEKPAHVEVMQPQYGHASSQPQHYPILIKKRQFTNGMCGCCSDMKECACAWFCPCIFMIRLFRKADESCCSCMFGGSVPLRTKIRTERGIEGSICADACALSWCPCCVLQEDTYKASIQQPTSMSQDIEITVDEQDWRFGLYDCCAESAECCSACCCTGHYQVLLLGKVEEPICSMCYGGMVPLRTRIRTERAIKGSIWRDLCAVACCPLCALVQMGREVKDREPIFKAK